MAQDELVELLDSWEGRDVEFKEARRAVPQSAYETVSAFANTEGGRLVFGVSESGGNVEIVGVLDVDKVQSDFLSTLRQRTKISVLLPFREQLTRHEGKDLLIFHVPEARRSEKPVFLDGDIRRAFVRSGGSDVRLTDAERDRFLVDAATERYDSQPVDFDPHQAFDEDSLRWYRAAYESRPGNRSHSRLDDLGFLGVMGLLRDEGRATRPTRAAILLFGADRTFRQLLPRMVVDCQRFRLRRDDAPAGSRWFDRLVLEDNLVRTWRALMDTWHPKLAEYPFRVDPVTLQRDDTPPDLEAFREAAANLLMHQDYADSGRNAEILHYPDQVVFRNPGDAFAAPSELLKPGEKEQRNPRIVLSFRRIGLSESAGWGLRDVFRNWTRLGRVPPRIVNSRRRKRFELVLRMEAIAERQRNLEQRLGVHLDAAETRIVDFAESRDEVSLGEMCVIADVTKEEAARAADRLATQRLLEPSGAARFRFPERLRSAIVALGHAGSDQVRARPTDLVTPTVTKSDLTDTEALLVAACETPRSMAELMQRVGALHRSHFTRTHLRPLMDAGIVRMTNPENPRAANQRYVLTERGAALRAERLRPNGTGTP